jgi:asparagine synthase (glutamine-hydrolysing)
MCGILGLLQPNPFNGGELLGMARQLRHRGPDDEGYLIAGDGGTSVFGGEDTPQAVFESDVSYVPRTPLTSSWRSLAGGLALAHRRLSIVDLSAHGHQPMSYRNRYWIVFNGEIYNYLELRDELSLLDHNFSSHSDTEVILAAYAQWGPACLSRFNGMWGLAILDLQSKNLFIARDRFGVKPVYYRIANGRLAFASEIKAFCAMSDWRPKANLAQLLDFLVWSVIDHTAETMFDGVQQLAAGHYLLLDVSGLLKRGTTGPVGNACPQRWYCLPKAGKLEPVDAAAELRSTLEDAVRLRLRADVPVGSCLSGGLDSSAIVCLMNAQLEKAGVSGTLKTFTSQSDDGQFDETRYAQAVISRTEAAGHFVNPSPIDLFDNLDRMTWHQDSPLISSSCIAQWLVFQSARKNGVIVMLDGQGADEILCGYRGFFGAYLAGLIRQGHLLSWLKEIKAMKHEIGFSSLKSLGYTLAYLRPEMLGLLGRFDKRAYSDSGWLRPTHRSAFYTDPVRYLGGRASSVRDMSIAQVTATNLPMLLHWEDRNSMAFSVEARVPFLDYRVVELCLQFSDSLKLGGGISKAVLRQSMRGLVPDNVLNRRDKMGFVTAEPLWMKRDLAPRFQHELAIAVDVLSGIIDSSILGRFKQVLAGTRPFDLRYWRVISAARWATTFSVTI